VKVRIEGGGHAVEIEHSDDEWPVDKTAALAEQTFRATRGEHRGTMGYGSQLIERTRDAGGFAWEMGKGEQPTVTA
jgi:hypothetical protein